MFSRRYIFKGSIFQPAMLLYRSVDRQPVVEGIGTSSPIFPSLPRIEGSPSFTFPTDLRFVIPCSKLKWQSGWWFQPIWKILVQLDHFPKVWGEHKNVWNHHPAIAGKSPFSIGNTSSIQVHFSVSHVSLPEGICFKSGSGFTFWCSSNFCWWFLLFKIKNTKSMHKEMMNFQLIHHRVPLKIS